ncbi:RNA-directed DNA polymerase, partial [Bacteroides sp.]|uniref:RNA-directed DNA polymerase n=1 Tax=Bacteroides sp. TaxID=29523 RepID=UPI0026240262
CMDTLFNKLEYRTIDKSLKTREKWMAKSINIGDQISQLIGVFYPSRIDSYVKTVRSQKFYGRYMDDFYIISQSKEELQDILGEIEKIANDLGIFINHKKTAIVKLSQPFTYLQLRYYVTSTGHITRKLGKKRVHSMRVKLKKMSQQEETKFDDAVTMFRSWMGSFYKLLPDNTRKEILAYFENLYDCKITIRKVKHKYKMFFSQN